MPLPELIVAVNRLYHAFEAHEYDQRHPEVHDQLPSFWKRMIAQVDVEPLQVLDFGCGTGFESEQLLNFIPAERIGALVCYDPSAEMLRYCRDKIAPRFSNAVFCERVSDIPCDKEYTLLLTNSLLHHLPNPLQILSEIQPKLNQECFWCAGHEPSKKYYQNSDCINVFNKFRRSRLLGQLLNPSEVFRYTRNRFGLFDSNSVSAKTAKEAYKKGLFATQPPAIIIGLLVDYHVAHSVQEAESGRGFCVDEMSANLTGRWNLKWAKSYSFMGNFYEKSLPEQWQKEAAKLERRFPNDGANFCAVWQRCEAKVSLNTANAVRD